MSGQQLVTPEPHRQCKRLTWLFWLALGVILTITLALGVLVFWIIKTQDLTKASSIVSLIASIVVVLCSPLVLLFTIAKWPERQSAEPHVPLTNALAQPVPEPSRAQGRAALLPQIGTEQPQAGEVWNIPYRRNPFFTGREQLLTRLHDNLTTGRAAALTQPQAISGLGGIGKTQIAVEYAYRYRRDYRAVLWASAASPDTLLLDFVALAGVLGLPEQQATDQTITLAAVKGWLVSHEAWLLILDNADDLEMLTDFLPAGTQGHILITTRAQATGTLAHSIEVQEMEQAEGVLLLLRRARRLAPDAPLEQAPQEERSKAQAIVAAMAGLPLALDQAGAYLEETGCTLSSYLEQYQRRQLALLKRRGGPGSEHRDPVATTWSLSFEQVEQRNLAAADLLRCCAFLAPDAIPIEMLAAGATQLGPRLQPLADDPSLLDEPIAMLRRYSLVRRNSQDNTLAIHRLVQFMLTASMNDTTQHEWAERTVRAINQAFPSVEMDTWPQCQRYLPHAQACADLIAHHALAFPEAARLLNEAATYLSTHALYQQAEPLLKRALAISEKMLGPEHPATAGSLNNLASLYQDQGDYQQAELLYKRALAISEKVQGPEHPDTATYRENYTALLMKMNQQEKRH